MAFDVAGARNAGYSEDEIADHLAGESRFDASAAREAGYSASDIIGHLTAANAASAPQKASTPPPKASILDKATGFMANVNRGLGIGDEIAGAIKGAPNAVAALGRGDFKGAGNALQEGMASQRAIEDRFQASNPHTAALARGVGNAGQMVVPAGATANALAGGARVANMTRGAVTAGLAGATASALDRGTVGERLTAASETARNPVVLGLGAAGGALAPVAAKAKMVKAPKQAAPTLEELTAAKNAAYMAVDESGVRYKPEAFQELAGNITADLSKPGVKISAMRHPAAHDMLTEIQDMAAKGEAPSLTELDQLRQVVRRDVVGKSDPAEKFMGERIVEQIDEFIAATDAGKLLGGDGPQATEALLKARDLNSRVRKIEAINTAVADAKERAGSTGSGGNVDNATRQNLRAVKKKAKGLTADEEAAFGKAIVGGQGQNVLRQIGKLSPQGNGLMAAGNLASAASYGPAGAVPGAAGLVSKYLADAITKRRVNDLVDLIARGGEVGKHAERVLVERAAIEPQVADLYRQVSARLSKGAGRVSATASAGR